MLSSVEILKLYRLKFNNGTILNGARINKTENS
jgi:hypothetical protein